LIAPNFAGYLLSKGLTNRAEKKLIKEIEDIVTEFNRKFDDTEVDSNYFVDFLEQNKISDTIIQRVFNAYKTLKEDYEAISKKLVKEAVEFVNIKKDKFKHTHVKKPSDFEEYFSELFEISVNF
jgi:ribosomal protein L9